MPNLLHQGKKYALATLYRLKLTSRVVSENNIVDAQANKSVAFHKNGCA